ncbi:ribonuclease H-like domain-containing protein, partial [Tanacetum coccineum]
ASFVFWVGSNPQLEKKGAKEMISIIDLAYYSFTRLEMILDDQNRLVVVDGWTGRNADIKDAKRQHTISRSSAEAEYHGVANVVAETAWLRNLLRELHSPLSTVTLVYCDNVIAVYMSVNPVQHQRTNHIEIDIHFVCDMVTAGQVRVLHVPSRYQYADIFTKGLPSTLFEEFRSSLSVRPSPAPTAGAYWLANINQSMSCLILIHISIISCLIDNHPVIV